METNASLSPYLGMRLSEAEPYLREAGIPYMVVRTEPDWKRDSIEGPLRIIRVRTVSEKDAERTDTERLELVCCPVADPFDPERKDGAAEYLRATCE